MNLGSAVMRDIKERVTLKEIADKVGIAVNSVSRALKGCDNISKETQKRVREVADELGYIPNIRASSLRNGNSKVIAIVYDYFINPYYSIMTYMLDEMLSKENYRSMIFIDINVETVLSRKVAEEIISYGVSGVITFLKPSQSAEKLFSNFGIPHVLIGRNGADINVDSVYSDDFKGGYLAGKALIGDQRKNICYLGTKESVDCNIQRYNGYKAALQEAGLTLNENLVKMTSNAETGDELVKQIIEKNTKFDGIFCFSDLIAFEVIDYLLSNGFKIPSDVGIVGFDNIQQELKLPFRLSTIETNKRKIVEEALKIIFTKINNKGMFHHRYNIMIDVDYHQGNSTTN